jgi:ribosomal protein L7/L12
LIHHDEEQKRVVLESSESAFVGEIMSLAMKNKVQAVKYVRDNTGLGLAEAHALVNDVLDKNLKKK